MKKYLLIFAVTLFVTNSCKKDPQPTKGDIAGRITEEGSNTPIAAATIMVTGAEQSYKTGEDGSYKISDLYANDYSVTVSKQGYLTDTKQLTVVPEKTTLGDFSLYKDIPIANPNSVALKYSKQSESIELENTRSGEMQFTTQTSKTWLSVSPETGTIASQNKRIIIITANFENLPFGNYDEKLIINVGEASLSIPVQIIYVEPPYINIEKPEKDEVYKMGETMPITWNSNLTGKVRIDLMKYSSVSYEIKQEVLNEEGGNYSWQIPALDSTSYQLQITSIENESISSISEAFTLVPGPTAPTVITKNTEDITSNSIKIGGSITNIGLQASQVDQYGHVYSKVNPNPTIADNKTTLGTTNITIDYTSTITNLDEGETYYVAAYATNTKGTAYGDVLTITTLSNNPTVETAVIVSITQTGAVSGGTVSSNGGNTIIERGICYGTSSPVDIYTNIIKDADVDLGSFTSTLSDLTQGTTYFVRAYAKNSTGVGYGDEKTFKTLNGLPTVTSLAANTISGTKANASGRVIDNGGESLSSYGFCYSTNTNPTIGNTKYEVGTTISGDYSADIDNLIPATSYYLRAYASNSVGTAYGDQLAFTTDEGGYINFTSPYKDEEYAVGETHNITWTSSFTDRRIIIEHWNNGELSSELTNNANITDNSYSWFVPENTPVSTNNTIKITDYETLESIGESQTFTIPGELSIIKPNEGYLAKLDSLVIEWQVNYSTTFTIELYQGTQYMAEIATNVSSSANTFVWDAAAHGILEGTNYRVKIIDENNATFSELSGLFDMAADNTIFTDSRDGQTYKIVTIGTQTWFAQNLNYQTSNSYCNDCENKGRAYPESDMFIAIPVGWHLPTDEEWKTLEKYLGMTETEADAKEWRYSNSVGEKLKSTTGWYDGGNGTDEVGFNALPSYCYSSSYETKGTSWWSSTQYGYNYDYYYRALNFDLKGVWRGTTSDEPNYVYKNYMYIRCVKD